MIRESAPGAWEKTVGAASLVEYDFFFSVGFTVAFQFATLDGNTFSLYTNSYNIRRTKVTIYFQASLIWLIGMLIKYIHINSLHQRRIKHIDQ